MKKAKGGVPGLLYSSSETSRKTNRATPARKSYFRKVTRSYLQLQKNFSEQLFNIQQLWTIAPEDVD